MLIVGFVIAIREFVNNLLWLRSSFGNRNPEQVAMVSIRNLGAIQGCDPNRNHGRNHVRNHHSRTFQGCEIAIETLFATLKLSGTEVSTRVAIRVAIRIATLNRTQVSNRNHSNLFRVSISKR